MMLVRTAGERGQARDLLWGLAIKLLQLVNDEFGRMGSYATPERAVALKRLADCYGTAFDCLDRLGVNQDGEATPE